MSKYFELAELIELVEPAYDKYKKNQISFGEFCEAFKTNITRPNSRVDPSDNYPENSFPVKK